MSTLSERVRYFDSEYLRAADFQAEQAYHKDMRRKLNLELHLFGIVEGLDLVQDQDSFGPAAVQFSVSAGFAIDQNGREIVVASPYALATDTVLRRQGTREGSYELWIVYQENASGRPSAGYSTCNDPGQNTRIQESFEIVLVPSPRPAPKSGVTIPDPDGAGGLRLGTVTVATGSGGLFIDTATAEHRIYIGLRAQRIVEASEVTPAFAVLNQNISPSDTLPPDGYLAIEPSVYVEGNAFLAENAVVGQDFLIDTTKARPKPAPPDTGNLKVAGDLFLNGDLFANVGGQWYGIAAYVKTFLPEFQFASTTLTFAADGSSTTSNAISLTSQLPSVSSAQVFASIVSFNLKGKNDLGTWWSTVAGAAALTVSVNPLVTPQTGTPNKFNLTFGCQVTPPSNPIPPPPSPTPIVMFDSVVVKYMVIFFP